MSSTLCKYSRPTSLLGLVALLFTGALIAVNAPAQSTFQNLDFEMTPTVVGSSPNFGNYYAIPYWTATMGPYQGGVTLNTYVLDATTVSLQTSSPIDGTTSVFLTASSFGYPLSTASLSQTGLVPTTAESLQFKVADIMAYTVSADLPGQFFVTLDGQNVPLQVVANNGSYAELAGDISNWAGQTAALTIGMSVPASQGPENYFQGLVDDISFSSVIVPEPSSVSLGLLASGLLFVFRRICN